MNEITTESHPIPYTDILILTKMQKGQILLIEFTLSYRSKESATWIPFL